MRCPRGRWEGPLVLPHMETSSDVPFLAGLAAVVVLLALNAFFVAAEFALVGSRRTRLEGMATHGDRRAVYALRILDDLPRYISATQVGITLCSLALGWIGEPSLAHAIRAVFAGLPDHLGPVRTDLVASVVAFTVITFTLLIVGEMLPKAIALLHPETLSGWVAAPLMGFAWLMAVPTMVVNRSATRVLKALGLN